MPKEPIEVACAKLQALLADETWFTSVGIGDTDGQPCLFLYVTAIKHGRTYARNGWHGWPVEVRKMGQPRPA